MPDARSDRSEFLKTVDILAKAGMEDVKAIDEIAQERRHQDGELVFREGGPADSLLIVVEGEVRCERAGSEITRIQVGETFGVSSFLENGSRTVNAYAVGPVKLLVLEREAFLQKAQKRPLLMQGLSSVMSRHLRSVLEVAISRRSFMGG